jgi:hypothetical protein
MAATGELIGGRRRQRHAVFLILQFLGDANDHVAFMAEGR